VFIVAVSVNYVASRSANIAVCIARQTHVKADLTMQRSVDGQYSFSWGRLMDNSFPVMGAGIFGVPPYLTPIQKDMFYHYQALQPVPFAMDERCLEAAQIVARVSHSKKAFKGLQKAGIISPQGILDTTRIDKKFTHHLASLPQQRQRQTVDLLFWWEEETNRLRKLLSERLELESMIAEASAEALPTYRLLRERVNGKIKAQPSQRNQVIEDDEDELMVRARAGSMADVSALLQHGARQQRRALAGYDDELPAYSRH